MMDFRRWDRRLVVETAVWLLLAALAFFFSFDIEDTSQTYKFGAASWPRTIILGMMMVALLQVLLHRHRSSDAAETVAPEQGGMAGNVVLRLGVTLGTPLLFIFLLPRTGFYLTTPVFIAAYLYLMGERRIVPLIVISLCVYAAVTGVFTSLFFVALPVGNWPGFYDFSNWFITVIR